MKKPFSFISALTGGSVSGDNKLKFVPGYVNNEGREVAKTDPVLENGSTKWNMTVIGHLVGYQMSYREIMGNLRRMWRPYEFDDIIMNNSGLYFCKFKSHDGMQTVIENGPWLVDNKPFFVQKWEPGLCMSKPELTKAPLWVKIFNVPLKAWNVEGII
ncbi:RNA-directed DNA polymerase, eukaryota, reverse transcriptase zinc-binding domain protein [Tanacetum coccineum]